MFKPEDFELSLESQLRLRMFNDEIEGCTDVDSLKSNLKDLSKLVMSYQNIINRLISEQITKNLTDFEDFINNKQG